MKLHTTSISCYVQPLSTYLPDSDFLESFQAPKLCLLGLIWWSDNRVLGALFEHGRMDSLPSKWHSSYHNVECSLCGLH